MMSAVLPLSASIVGSQRSSHSLSDDSERMQNKKMGLLMKDTWLSISQRLMLRLKLSLNRFKSQLFPRLTFKAPKTTQESSERSQQHGLRSLNFFCGATRQRLTGIHLEAILYEAPSLKALEKKVRIVSQSESLSRLIKLILKAKVILQSR